MCRGFFLGALLDFVSHRIFHFLEDVADQSDGARQHTDAADDFPRQLQFTGDGADGAGGVG